MPPNPHPASLPTTGDAPPWRGSRWGDADRLHRGSAAFLPALRTGSCAAAGASVGMSRFPAASPAAGAHPDRLHPSKTPRSHRLAGGSCRPSCPGLSAGWVSFPPCLPFFPPPPPSGSQLLITFACQPGLLICYRRAESGRSENKGDTITLCLLSSPIQISFID